MDILWPSNLCCQIARKFQTWFQRRLLHVCHVVTTSDQMVLKVHCCPVLITFHQIKQRLEFADRKSSIRLGLCTIASRLCPFHHFDQRVDLLWLCRIPSLCNLIPFLCCVEEVREGFLPVLHTWWSPNWLIILTWIFISECLEAQPFVDICRCNGSSFGTERTTLVLVLDSSKRSSQRQEWNKQQ